MGELRWVLLLVGAALLAGVYIYSHLRKSRSDQHQVERREPSLREHPDQLENLAKDDSSESESVSEPPPKIIAIRLLSRDSRGFPAEKLVLALRSADLRHGQFGIFHAHPEGSLAATVFSVASLTEPGSFDLTALKTSRYPGVSLFMALPGPLDGVTAFDQMVGCARQLADDLEGELSDEQGSTLSVQRQRYLREEVIHFQHGEAVG